MAIGIDLGAQGATIVFDDGSSTTVPTDLPRRRVMNDLVVRAGDPVPLVFREADGTITRQLAHDLYASEVARAMQEAGATPKPSGGRGVAVALPAWWTARATAMTRHAIQALAGRRIVTISDAEAAVRGFQARGGVLDDTVAVLDLGAQTSSAAILTSCRSSRPQLTGQAGVQASSAGDELDALILHHLIRSMADQGLTVDREDSAAVEAARAFVLQCRDARESLSIRSAVTLETDLAGADARLRLVRSEFEEIARPWARDVVTMLRTTIDSSGREIGSVLMVGGLARTPAVAQAISAELGLALIADEDPSHTVALGAMLAAGHADHRAGHGRGERWRHSSPAAAAPAPAELLPVSLPLDPQVPPDEAPVEDVPAPAVEAGVVEVPIVDVPVPDVRIPEIPAAAIALPDVAAETAVEAPLPPEPVVEEPIDLDDVVAVPTSPERAPAAVPTASYFSIPVPMTFAVETSEPTVDEAPPNVETQATAEPVVDETPREVVAPLPLPPPPPPVADSAPVPETTETDPLAAGSPLIAAAESLPFVDPEPTTARRRANETLDASSGAESLEREWTPGETAGEPEVEERSIVEPATEGISAEAPEVSALEPDVAPPPAWPVPGAIPPPPPSLVASPEPPPVRLPADLDLPVAADSTPTEDVSPEEPSSHRATDRRGVRGRRARRAAERDAAFESADSVAVESVPDETSAGEADAEQQDEAVDAPAPPPAPSRRRGVRRPRHDVPPPLPAGFVPVDVEPNVDEVEETVAAEPAAEETAADDEPRADEPPVQPWSPAPVPPPLDWLGSAPVGTSRPRRRGRRVQDQASWTTDLPDTPPTATSPPEAAPTTLPSDETIAVASEAPAAGGRRRAPHPFELGTDQPVLTTDEVADDEVDGPSGEEPGRRRRRRITVLILVLIMGVGGAQLAWAERSGGDSATDDRRLPVTRTTSPTTGTDPTTDPIPSSITPTGSPLTPGSSPSATPRERRKAAAARPSTPGTTRPPTAQGPTASLPSTTPPSTTPPTTTPSTDPPVEPTPEPSSEPPVEPAPDPTADTSTVAE